MGIHLATYFGVVEVVTELVGMGFNIDLMDSYRRTPLSWAAGNGHDAVVKLLLEKGPKSNRRTTATVRHRLVGPPRTAMMPC